MDLKMQIAKNKESSKMPKSEEEKIKDRIANTKYYLKNKTKVKEIRKKYDKEHYLKIKEKKGF